MTWPFLGGRPSDPIEADIGRPVPLQQESRYHGLNQVARPQARLASRG